MTDKEKTAYEEKKHWLLRYQNSLKREKELAEEVARLWEEAARVTPLLSAAPGGPGDGQGLARAVERIVEAQQRLQCQINQCAAIRQEVLSVIAQVRNQRDHEILRRRYILGQRWEAIAAAMGMELRWVYRRHRSAVASMTIESH